ncbi:MAG: hypothetical protein HY658_08200 [Actinobacteria bacterium]|nr:hypothetical protein [Actinomycetota bacterium]
MGATVDWARLAAWAREEGFGAGEGTADADGSIDVPGPGAPLGVAVRLAPDRVLLEHSFQLDPGELGGATGTDGETLSARASLERALDEAPGLLRGEIRSTGGTASISLTTTVHMDGLSKHAFVRAMDELARTRRSLDRLRADVARSREMLGSIHAGMEESRRRMEEATRREEAEAAPASTTTAPPPGAAPVAIPTAAPAWAPTHVAPQSGLTAWPAPDPSAQPVARLQPGTELRAVEWNGAWARVDAPNGWSGWVDGRLLVAT